VRVALHQGNYAMARCVGEEGLARMRATGEKLAIASVLGHLVCAAQLEGDDTRLEALSMESFDLSRQVGEQAGVAKALLGLGRGALHRGEAGQATSLYAEALTLSAVRPHGPGVVICLAAIAAFARAQAQLESAARMAGAAEALAEAAGFPPWDAERVEYQRTVPRLHAELEDRYGGAWAEGRAMTLAEAVEFGCSIAANLRAEVQAGLSSTSPTASPPSDPDSLTERQVETLRLLAAGKNNTEIAAALVLSIRTVERHIENIYEKLGIHGKAARARAAAYALRRGPTGR
jgi:DNA-binding CsgD family transcriptional regulator